MNRFDLLIVGGGINGAAIARDAAARGLKTMLVEKDDLAAHTSSASSKLVHGGLRYLERYRFRLVRELLREREVMLRTAPHLVRPLRFVLPDPPGGRPTWLLRAGLALYDRLAGRSSLPRSGRVPNDEAGLAQALQPGFRLLSYWDAWVDDARLVVLNAVAAAEAGATIATRTELVSARRERDGWTAQLSGGRNVAARMIVNAAGPWVADVLNGRLGAGSRSKVRLVKGSHILVPRLWQGGHAYLLQQPDGRIVFALPFEGLTLIGTTDVPVASPGEAEISAAEADYLCAAASAYFTRRILPADIIWSYAGVRALHDDGSTAAKDVTREYHLELAAAGGGKLLSVFGGKITTARALAERALAKLGVGGRSGTATRPLPGGEPDPEPPHPGWLPAPMLARMTAAYGSRVGTVTGGAGSVDRLGRHFGAGLYEAEVRYLIETEFARSADDILWRRTKLGLVMTPAEQAALADFLQGPSGSGAVPRSGTAPLFPGWCGMALSAAEAAAQAGSGDSVIGWKLDRDQRRELLQQFPPRFGHVVADHVTLAAKAAPNAPLPGEKEGEIVGRADDGDGVEAMVVAIAGTTDRPGGGTFHITWSLGDGREAKESNDVIAARGWERLELPMPVRLEPARWP